MRRLLALALLAGAAMTASALPPAPDREAWLMDRAQANLPDVFPGAPIIERKGRVLLRRYANGNVLAAADFNMYMAGPATGNAFEFLGPVERLDCIYLPVAGNCPHNYRAFQPRPQFPAGLKEEALVWHTPQAFALQLAKKPGLPSAAESMVDWRYQMVIGVVLGAASPPCTSVFIVRVDEGPTDISVTYRVSPPFTLARCDEPRGLAADFATIVKSDKPVHFDRAGFDTNP